MFLIVNFFVNILQHSYKYLHYIVLFLKNQVYFLKRLCCDKKWIHYLLSVVESIEV